MIGSFIIPPGTSPEALALRRRLAYQALQNGTDYSPIQSPWQGLARVAQGALGGYQMNQIEGSERADREEGNKLLTEALAALDPNAAPASSSSGASSAPAPASIPATPAQGSFAAAGTPYTGQSSAVRDLIKREEGYAPQAKWDVRQNSGGYGSRAAPGEVFTREKAEEYLSRDLKPVEAWIDKNAPNANINQRAALASFGYNLGTDDLDKLKPDIQRGDWARVGERMLSFNNAATGPGGALERSEGLTSRRRREAALVMGESPSVATGGGGDGGTARPSSRLAIAGRLMSNPRTAEFGKALAMAELTKEKEKPQVVSPGAALVDNRGNLLYQAPQEDAALKAERTEVGKRRGEAKAALPGVLSGAEESIGMLNRLRTHRGLDQGTGITSLYATRIPGTAGYAFGQLREQAQGTAFLTGIGALRGTGAITEVEGKAATQAVARMSSAQSKEDFLEALDDYERVIRKGVANAYRQAGMDVPEGVMGERRAPAASSAPTQQAGIEAPAGLREGAIIRDTQSGQVMIVEGGRLVPQSGQAAPGAQAQPVAAEEPQSLPSVPRTPPATAGASAAAAGRGGPIPNFTGKWTSDRRMLLDNPSAEAITAFDQRYGRGKAITILGGRPKKQDLVETIGRRLAPEWYGDQ